MVEHESQEHGQEFEYQQLAEDLRVVVARFPTNLQLLEVFGWDRVPWVGEIIDKFKNSRSKRERVFLSSTMTYLERDSKLWGAEIKDVPGTVALKDEGKDLWWRFGIGPKRREFLRIVFSINNTFESSPQGKATPHSLTS